MTWRRSQNPSAPWTSSSNWTSTTTIRQPCPSPSAGSPPSPASTSNGNRLTELPESIGEIRGLTSLDCSANDLRTLPSAIGNLTQLTGLGLHGNRLRELPEAFGSLTRLFKAAPWVHAMAVVLQVALSARVDGTFFSNAEHSWTPDEAQAFKLRRSFLDASEFVQGDSHTMGDASPRALLQELHAVLRNRDEGPGFGGLVRVRNRGRYLWVHPRFEAELNPGLPEMGRAG